MPLMRRAAALVALTALASFGSLVWDDVSAHRQRSFRSFVERCIAFSGVDGLSIGCEHFPRLISVNGVKLAGDVNTLPDRSIFVCEWFEETVWREERYESLGLDTIPICWVVDTMRE